MRIATFLGGLHRGLDPREAAQRASDDPLRLRRSDVDREGRLPSPGPVLHVHRPQHPAPGQGDRHPPGKFATLQKAREEGRKAQGLPTGYEESLDPYEARQLGIPISFGGKKMTASFGSPFVDLNDVTAAASGQWKPAVQRSLEMLGPWKTPIELAENVSFFYRDQIKPKGEPETAAPQWAVALANAPGGKAWAKMNGLTPDFLDTKTGKPRWGWSKSTDYFWRQAAVGPIGLALRAPQIGGVKETVTARGQSPGQVAAGIFGMRLKDYEPARAEMNKLWQESDKLEERQATLNDRKSKDKMPDGRYYPIGAEHPTPEYTRNAERLKAIEERKYELEKKLKPKGIIRGKPVSGGSTGGGLQLPSRRRTTGGGIRLPPPRAARGGGGIVLPPAR